MSDAWRRLAHDVGKYVARIARNVPDDAPFPEGLRPLLLKDLYESPAGDRPSARFEALARHLEDARLEAAREDLRAIDALEPAVRSGDPEATARACALARAVDDRLRAVAGEGA